MHKEAKTNDQTCFTMMLSKACGVFQIATYIATKTCYKLLLGSIKVFHKISVQRVFLRYVTNCLYVVFSI